MPRVARSASAPRRRSALRRLALLALVLAAGGGGFMWLRDSSLVGIRTVTVTGVSSSEGAGVRRALTEAARRMTTLRVDRPALRAAVSRFSSVARITTQTDFPHGLAIEVTERHPVAAVQIAGRAVPVGAGGRLMRGLEPQAPLPRLKATRLAPGGRLADAQALGAVAVLAAAPDILRRRISRVWTGPKGLTLDVRSGPELFFGSPGRLRAKWMATARILAEPAAAGAVYLDVRVPERVAAGGLGALSDPSTDDAAADPQLQPEETPTLDP